VLENLNLLLAAKRLGGALTWHQIFTDDTSRRQIALQKLVIELMEDDNNFELVIAALCIFLEDETSKKQVKGIKSKEYCCNSCFGTLRCKF
jgi:hypothetical protein